LGRVLKRFLSGQQFLNRYFSPTYWLRPDGNNRSHLLHIAQRAATEKMSYIQFMLHSSELMPGGSPTFPLAQDIEILYEDLEILFSTAHEFVGRTLKAHHQQIAPMNKSKSDSSLIQPFQGARGLPSHP
ncbi:hypothetical protein IH992_12040, partial [Candidatus Poribacteria bacterium]|nr:hypothetical protein [Candidatus Poribacteria bacterium]